jgi:hypothetical protein
LAQSGLPGFIGPVPPPLRIRDIILSLAVVRKCVNGYGVFKQNVLTTIITAGILNITVGMFNKNTDK